ncbi:phosphoglycerate mutase-like protein [Hypoxylon sp. FL0890]|nr:phosphoglycerate mutase-like protein [Hypoxylon sp. FL0890]
MAPTIDIVRHAEAFHNIAGTDFPDPPITRRGRSHQCKTLRRLYPFGNKVTHIVSSPLRRAIDTALATFEPIVEDDVPIILLPELQEINATQSSTGSEKRKLQDWFDDVPTLDMSELTEDWYLKGSDTPFAPNVEKVEARAKAARSWLRTLARTAREDAHIVVVTHGEFAHWLTNDFIGVGYGSNSGWAVCEFRSYQFANLYAPTTEDVPLVETDESLERRSIDPMKGPVSPDRRNQAELKRIASITVQLHANALEAYESQKRSELELRGVVPDEESDEAWFDIDEDADKENQY